MSRNCCIGTHIPADSLLSQRALRSGLAPRHGRSHRLQLTVRSTEARFFPEYRRVLSSLDSHKLEVLRDIDETSYQQLASCEANAKMQDDDMASLLLRVTAFHRLWCQQHADADRRLCDINFMISKIALMTRLLAGGSSQLVLQTIEYVVFAALGSVHSKRIST